MAEDAADQRKQCCRFELHSFTSSELEIVRRNVPHFFLIDFTTHGLLEVELR